MSNGIYRVPDPLQQRLREVQARLHVADGAVRVAIESWVMVRAAYGGHVQGPVIALLVQSGLLSNDVARFIQPPDSGPPKEATQ